MIVSLINEVDGGCFVLDNDKTKERLCKESEKKAFQNPDSYILV
jgi:hypothetical protein